MQQVRMGDTFQALCLGAQFQFGTPHLFETRIWWYLNSCLSLSQAMTAVRASTCFPVASDTLLRTKPLYIPLPESLRRQEDMALKGIGKGSLF